MASVSLTAQRTAPVVPSPRTVEAGPAERAHAQFVGLVRAEQRLVTLAASTLDGLANSQLHAGLSYVLITHRRRLGLLLASCPEREARRLEPRTLSAVALRAWTSPVAHVLKGLILRLLVRQEEAHLAALQASNVALAQLPGAEAEKVWHLVAGELMSDQEALVVLVRDLLQRYQDEHGR